jgi:hypothetical protein
LAFGGRATVAAHGRNDEWFRAVREKVIDDGFCDVIDVRDAAAADGDGDACAGANWAVA